MSRQLAGTISSVVSAGHVSAAALAAAGILFKEGLPLSSYGRTFVIYGGTTALACSVAEALMPVVEKFVGEGSDMKDMDMMRKRIMHSVVSGAVAELILMMGGISQPSLSSATAIEALILGSSCWAGPMIAGQLMLSK